jgi:DNA polymerase-1
MPGSGPLDADIMIVGEAPGQREDSEGSPFLGSAGKLLDKALAELAVIDRAQCYITNVVKCRPPDNRTPERAEIKTCAAHYLFAEIDKVHPRFVLLLGNVALQALLGRSGITKYAGTIERQRLNGEEAAIMPTLHPAAILRNPSWAKTFAMDMQRFGALTRGEATSPETLTKVVRTKEALVALRKKLMKVDVLAYDIETFTFADKRKSHKRTNFQEWHGEDSCIVSISFTWDPGLSVVVPLWHESQPWPNPQVILDYLRPALERPNCEYIGHNGKFDARWMAAKGVNIPQGFDTMLAAHMLEENRPKGLKNLSRTELGAEAYDVGEDLRDAYGMPLKRLVEYNGKDTDYTRRLRDPFKRELVKDARLEKVFTHLMMPASNALVDIERAGVWLDPQRWQKRHDQSVENREKILAWIRKQVPEGLTDTKTKAGRVKANPFNPRSPVHMAKLLFDHLGLPVIEKTARGARSTKESVLLRLQHQHRIPLAIMKYRKWELYLSRYLLPFMFQHMDNNGRIHSNYKLFGTVTGRLSGEGGIQQVPRDPFIRSILGAPPGWFFVQADYSQVELRIAAWLANETTMISQYLRGEDIHMNRAVKMTGKIQEQIAKEERKKAKAVNFGYIYGMGAEKFVQYAFDNYELVVTLEEAEKDRNGFFNDYPRLRPWHERQRRLANRYKRVVSPIGRIRHLPDIQSQEKGVRNEAERQAINSPVQSFASDLMLMSLVRLHDSLPQDRAFIVGTVHDSLLFQVKAGPPKDPYKYVNRYCREIKDTMEDLDYVKDTFGPDITVPIVADMEVGQHWGETGPWEG